MKQKLLTILLIVFTLQAIGQSSYNNGQIINLNHFDDCLKFEKFNSKKNDSAQLIRSYQFNEKGNIIKIVYTPQTPKGINIDTSFTVFNYDEKDNLIGKTHYLKQNNDTIVQTTKVIYIYNKKGFLERVFCVCFGGQIQFTDTIFTRTYTYNLKGQKEIEVIRNLKNNSAGGEVGGVLTFNYDKEGRIKDVQKIAKNGRYNETNSPYHNYSLFYIYYGDTAYTETQVYGDSFMEKTYFTNKKVGVWKVQRSFIQDVKTNYVNGKYFPDLNSKTAYIQNRTTIYLYDKLCRIEKYISDYESEDKGDGFKTSGQYSHFFKYKDDKPYKLPTEEYMEDN